MENKKEMRNWLEAFNLTHPLVIAGPCSAETEEQVLKIAHELKDSDVSVFRAGIWKPRTRPGGFEGRDASGRVRVAVAYGLQMPQLAGQRSFISGHESHAPVRSIFP